MKFDNGEKIFFTSDTHFWHKNILKYVARCAESRGQTFKDVKEMNEGLRERWNETVPKDGIVFMLGDTFFQRDADRCINYMKTLNGKKHLIFGNHDQIIRKNIEKFLSVFETISDYKEIKVGKQFIVLFHYAPRVWNKAHRGSWCLWGHSHGTLEPLGKSVDVGIDSPWVTGKPELRPFSFHEVKDFMEKQEFKKIDHHGD